ncbi:MAG: CotH kinase family protein [Pirellulales bacterium]
MASNDSTLVDIDGTSADWIELHNPSSQPINLEGWALTDDTQQLDKWKLPYVTIDPQGYLVVFASAKDRPYDSYRLTTDFNATPDGTFLVDLPTGQYDVRVTLGDATRTRDDVDIYIQGAIVDSVTTAAGEFVAKTFLFEIDTASGGQLALRLVDRGGETGRATVGAVIVRSRDGSSAQRFDFGSSRSLVEDGFVRVTVEDTYRPSAGFGWQAGTVVSAQDRGLSQDNLHTNFKLSSQGERVALVSPDGVVVSELDPDGTDFPGQFPDVAYGIVSDQQRLLDPDRPFSYRVPSVDDGAVAAAWTEVGFDDADWTTTENTGLARGVGAVRPGAIHAYDAHMATNLADRVIGVNASLWIRQPFTVDDVDSIQSLVLRMKYDDGFVATINGVRVAEAAAPDSLPWNATATESRDTNEAVVFVDFDLTPYRDALVNGANLLAIVGLNRTAVDQDLLIVPQLIASGPVDSDSAEIGYLARPTPGLFNAPLRAPSVTMNRPSGVFADPFDLMLVTDVPGTAIHYTTDASTPTAQSPLFDPDAPLTIASTTLVQAVAIPAGREAGAVSAAWYVTLDADLESFSSNLPIVLLEHFGGGLLAHNTQRLSAFAIYEPSGDGERTSLTGSPDLETRAGVKVRGSNSSSKPKKPFAVEAWDETNRDKPIAPLGMPANSDWILFSPYDTDVAMLRNSFIFDISNQMGRYAVRTRFVELFQNTGEGDLSADDYQGVYVLMEKVKRGPSRVDIAELEPQHETEPVVSGGWILEIGRPDPGDRGFLAGGQGIGNGAERLKYVDPKEEDVTPAQAAWIRSFIDQMAASLTNPDPETGYPQYIDVDAWIDHHILNTFAKNVDGLRLSTFLYKDRGGKLTFGPVWDFDRSIDSPDGRDNLPTTWNGDTRYFDTDTRHPWWGTLFQNPEFTQRWWRRWQALRQDVLSDANIAATIDRLASQIEEAQVRNFAKWTDDDVQPRTSASPNTYDTGELDGTWRGEVEHMKAWLRERMNWMDGESPLVEDDARLTISEFMASNQSTLDDEDGLTSDWIEILNGGSEPVSLAGWYLTDNATIPDKWTFPDVTLPAGGTLIVFASGKNRTDASGELHTNFKLSSRGEYLGLVRPDLTVAHDFGPSYPPQQIDVSYGLSPGFDSPGFLAEATPGGENGLLRAAQVEIDQPSRMFREPVTVTLSVDAPDAVVFYTTDGSVPHDPAEDPLPDEGGDGESPVNTTAVYTDPITITKTTLLQAIAVAPGRAESTVTSRWYTTLDSDLTPFTSNLPIIVIDNFGAGDVGDTTFQLNSLSIFEPDPISGRTSLDTPATLESRVGLKIRGSNSAGKPKRHYAVEAWDENNRDRDIAPLDMPAESDWILFPPYDTDQSLMSNSLIFELSNQMGRYASRTRFVEVYQNTDGGDLTVDDYQGVYVLMEKIKRGPNRVDVTELKPQDNAEPDISGGWMVKIDRPDPGDQGFVAGKKDSLQYVDPKEEAVTPEQAAWIKNYLDTMEASLTDTDPDTGYAKYIDVDAWIDHHILNVLGSNNDALKNSTYLFKPRGGKLAFGPIWDFDRAFGHDEDDRDDNQTQPDEWQGNRHTQFFEFPWWRKLFDDPNFMQKWIDRWDVLRETVFSEENINRIIDTMKRELDEAQVRNFDRWPDVRPNGGLFAPDDMQNWDGEILNLRNWILLRLAWIDSQFEEPPTLTPNGGTLTENERIVLGPNAEAVYYTTDGSDPRLPGGQIGPAARPFGRVDTLVDANSDLTWKIPSGSADEVGWETLDYQAPNWSQGNAVLGFDTGITDSTSTFTVREVHSTGTLNNLADADALLGGQGVAPDVTVTDVPSINYLESTGDGHFDGNAPFPGGGGNNFAIRATTQLFIDQAGLFTFGVNTDDGLRLTIDGEDVIVDDTIHGSQDSFGTMFLEAGAHDLELVTFDRTGSSGIELFMAPGEHDSFDTDFRLLTATERPYASVIRSDVVSDMYGIRSSTYLRVPFTVARTDDVLRLVLQMKYDDGFVAYLNGTEVARRNAPAGATFDSAALTTRPDAKALVAEAIDISPFAELLRDGDNVLAIHGLNASGDNPDFLIAPQLEATVIDNPVVISGITPVTARALSGSDWSAPTTAFFSETAFATASNLRVTEVGYRPSRGLPELGELDVDRDEFEFIELQNIGTRTIDLEGAELVESLIFDRDQGVRFTFASQELAPGERIVVVEDREAFQSRYGTEVRIADGSAQGGTNGQYGGKLSNRGEQIRLVDRFGQTIQAFAYGRQAPWPTRGNGGGSSLEVIDVTGNYNAPDNWRASGEYGGSPGRIGTEARGDVVINEVLPGDGNVVDGRVEIANLTGRPIDVSGWYLGSDSGDLVGARLGAGLTIAPHGYLVVPWRRSPAGFDKGHDGPLWLVAADASGKPVRFADRAGLVSTLPNISQGRWPDGRGSDRLVPLSEPTPGAVNRRPASGPLVLSEIHYRPAELPDVVHDFQPGSAVDFQPIFGNWNVVEDRYQVTPGAEGDTIAILPSLVALSSQYDLRATVRVPSSTTFNKNGALIFDYRGPDDFKFASIHPGSGKLRIGQRDAEGWQFLAQTTESISTDADIGVRLSISGSLATLWIDDQMVLEHDFAASLFGGRVGLGSKRGQATFDDVVVSRLGADDFEFLELANTSPASVDLTGWRLEGSVAWTFPPGAAIAADEVIVAVGFDPAASPLAAGFRSLYGMDPSVSLVGPFDGQLGNDGGSVELLEPIEFGIDDAVLGLVDIARYDAGAPWPVTADGAGRSLTRSAETAFGRFASSWIGRSPTPGRISLIQEGDLNLDGQTDTDDLAAFVLGLIDPDLYASEYEAPAVAAGDSDRDGDFDYDDIAPMTQRLAGDPATMATESTDVGRRHVDKRRHAMPPADRAPSTRPLPEAWATLADRVFSKSPRWDR